MVRCGMVRCGMVRCGIVSLIPVPLFLCTGRRPSLRSLRGEEKRRAWYTLMARASPYAGKSGTGDEAM